MVHVRRVDGRTLHFGHSGWLWRRANLLYDKETESIWHHQTGWAMSGPLRGAALPSFPATQSTFAAWVAEHPRTLVLPKPQGDTRPLGEDIYAARNAGLTFGLGVDLPTEHRLYRLAALDAAGGIAQETADGVPLVVVLDPEGRGAHAYDRRVAGGAVDLVPDLSDPSEPLLRERGGQRAWSLRSGRPVPSTGAREQLRRLLATRWETSAWKAQHPSGTSWQATAGDAAIPPGGR